MVVYGFPYAVSSPGRSRREGSIFWGAIYLPHRTRIKIFHVRLGALYSCFVPANGYQTKLFSNQRLNERKHKDQMLIPN
jgi:hypothetical protein